MTTPKELEGLRRIREIATASTASFSAGGLSPTVAAQLEAIVSRELGPAPAAFSTVHGPAVTMAKSDDATVLRQAADSVEAIIAGLSVELRGAVTGAVGILRDTVKGLSTSVPTNMSTTTTAAALHATRQRLADATALRDHAARMGQPHADQDSNVATLQSQLERQAVAFSQQEAAKPPEAGKASPEEIQRLIGTTQLGNAWQWQDKLASMRGCQCSLHGRGA